MRRYAVTREARLDLDEIWLYIAGDNPAAADRFLEKFHQRFKLLAENPGLGRARPEFAAGIRSYRLGSYLIFYRVKK